MGVLKKVSWAMGICAKGGAIRKRLGTTDLNTMNSYFLL